MRERVTVAGGTLSRERSSLGGTKLQVELPSKRGVAFLADMDISEEPNAAPTPTVQATVRA
jgi:signal transduction histidine kinase